jgi:CRP/FNR family transcriptional regulator
VVIFGRVGQGSPGGDPDMKDKYEVDSLRQIQLFSSLGDEELLRISERFVIKRFRKGEIILCEDDTTNFMYIILSGKVKVIQTTEDGKEIVLAFHKSGDFFGEMSLIDGKTSPATVMTTEDTSAAIIHRSDFFTLIHSEKKVVESLLHIFCSRLRDSWERIQMLNFKNASQRVKTLLFMLSEEHGVRSEERITLTIKLTHQDIADMTGLTRETVTRVLDRWLREGDIVVEKNRCLTLCPSFHKSELGIMAEPVSRPDNLSL